MTKRFAWSAVKVSGLRVDAITLDSFHFDFGDGYGERYDVLQPEGAEPGDENWQEPMMNYWWPLPDGTFGESHASLLAESPFSCCIVYNSDTEEYGIALTGGGMDLSWDIAGAYVLLGFTPPASLRLPSFAGLRLDTRHRIILSAMERSYRVLSNWMASNLRDLRYMRKQMAATR